MSNIEIRGEEMTATELREHFIKRDTAAVEDFHNSGIGHTPEARLAFVEGRLQDTTAALMRVLKALGSTEL